MNKHFAEVVRRAFRDQTTVNGVLITVGDAYTDETEEPGTVTGIIGHLEWPEVIWESANKPRMKCYRAEHFIRACKLAPQ